MGKNYSRNSTPSSLLQSLASRSWAAFTSSCGECPILSHDMSMNMPAIFVPRRLSPPARREEIEQFDRDEQRFPRALNRRDNLARASDRSGASSAMSRVTAGKRGKLAKRRALCLSLRSRGRSISATSAVRASSARPAWPKLARPADGLSDQE